MWGNGASAGVLTLLRRAGAAAALAACAPALAGGAHTLAISATIVSKNICRFTNAGPSALAFGAIDPSSGSAVVATMSTTFRCTGSDPVATYLVTSDDGLNESGPGAPRMLHAVTAGNFLPYALDLPQTASVPRNVVQTLTVTGTIAPSSFANALVGAYADTVVLTIAP
jgi:spore coat protein U-like protein